MKIEQIKNVKFVHGGCMEYMNEIDDKYDLAIVDPPYGINVNMNMGRRKHEKNKFNIKEWDKSIPSKAYFKSIFSISKNQIIWGANHFVNFIPASRAWIVWNKMITGEVQFSQAELAFSSFNNSLKMVDISVQNTKEKRIHPTQKPVKLYKWLLLNYAQEGWRIIDTHGGSGSIAIACYDLGFELTIIEKDEEYFNNMIKRFKDHTRQLKLSL